MAEPVHEDRPDTIPHRRPEIEREQTRNTSDHRGPEVHQADRRRLSTGERATGSGARHIRSFHPRRSRISPSAQSALLRLLPVLGVEVHGVPPQPSDLFEPRLPVVLEIGPGMGETTLAMAAARPDVGILAVDVHTPGIGSLLAGVERAGLTNVRVCVGDAVEVMERLAPQSLSGIRVFFPDPWPKVRHHKRRLVRPAFVERAAQLLAGGGTLHMATDIEDYAEQMAAACMGETSMMCTGFTERPDWRPRTKYERRGLDAGRVSRDVVAVKRAIEPAGF